MKDLPGQARVTTFLRNSLAEGAQDVRKLESMGFGKLDFGRKAAKLRTRMDSSAVSFQ
jgi:hypothetical protein